MQNITRVAIIGGGPSGLLMFKRFVEKGTQNFHLAVFEKQPTLGIGMPYGPEGASPEHITNVSGNEIPDLHKSLTRWIKELPEDIAKKYCIDVDDFNAYKVLPRILFGQYLADQFLSLKKTAQNKGLRVTFRAGVEVTDIVDCPNRNKVDVQFENQSEEFDVAIICTGHNWPRKVEKVIPGYFDSPYPPAKLNLSTNYPVAIRGASLSAIDAVKTMARNNGKFISNEEGNLTYQKAEGCPSFKMVMHSRNGLLPAIRFHLEDSHLSKGSVLSKEELEGLLSKNDGFVPIDYIFETKFKEPLKENDPEFYTLIKELRMEEFVEAVMNVRENADPFQLFRAEYVEAEESINNRESVYWKEMLAVLSFTMNYPAKYFSAEDMLRLKKVLMPLVSVVIAFVPQASVKEMLALHEAGVLELLSVGDNSEVVPNPKGGATYIFTDESGNKEEVRYKLFIDCIGQPHLEAKDLPFKSLYKNKTVSNAKLAFRDAGKAVEEMEKNPDKVNLALSGKYYMDVPGIAINDFFQVLDERGQANERIYMMAVPYIGGFNPDYSGLDFSEEASAWVFEGLQKRKGRSSD